jgi:hypothetical protein
MGEYAELEIGLYRRDAGSYEVDLRFTRAEDDEYSPPVRGQAWFDLYALRSREVDPRAYGTLLSESLLADPKVANTWNKVMISTQTLNVPLRLRLFIDPTALELHNLLWETLSDLQTGTWLLRNEHILFSRYLSSVDWRPVRLRPRGVLRALVVIANPTDTRKYQPNGRALPSVDMAGERARAQAALGVIPITFLVSDGTATLDGLDAALREGMDILYLVAHGALIQGVPYLWLEASDGTAAVTSGDELVTRLSELEVRPRLIVLAPGLAALGLRLVASGILAVIAMQANITMQTMEGFIQVFFTELQRDGQIDRALAVARSAVRNRPDAWIPMLFSRLRTCRLWYTPHFAGGQREAEFKKWPALLSNIENGRCIPILGAGLVEDRLGSPRDLANQWADTYGFPMAPHERADLPRVAQYMATSFQASLPRTKLVQHLRDEILQRYGADLPAADPATSLDDLLRQISTSRWARDPAAPHRVLAALPFPLYVTTNADNLLADALREAGRLPQVELYRWKDGVHWPRSVYETDPDYQPTVHRPLVYHLFGQYRLPESLVVTEDDYFDYLIRITRNNRQMLPVVRSMLVNGALLFLGSRLDDWDFRVLFRSIMVQKTRLQRSDYTHVAVQRDPEESGILNPERARSYLQDYVRTDDITIYWASTDDFVRELRDRWMGAGSTPRRSLMVAIESRGVQTAPPNMSALPSSAPPYERPNTSQEEIAQGFTLTGGTKRELVNLLTSAFPTRAGLDQLTQFHLNTSLNTIHTEGTDIRSLALGVVDWCLSQGGDMLERLAKGAIIERPHHNDLRKFIERFTPPA